MSDKVKPSFLADVKLPDPVFEEQVENPRTAPPKLRAKRQATAAAQRTTFAGDSALSTAAVVALLGGLGFAGWKAWQAFRARAASKGQPDAQGRRPGEQGYASPFKFKDSKSKKKNAHQESVSAVQAIPMRSTLPPPSIRPATNRPTGNPKKNKNVKQSRKDAKRAKEREVEQANEINSVIAARAKAKGIADAGKTPDVGLTTVVDFERTIDAYHNVAQWQETGKKTYKN